MIIPKSALEHHIAFVGKTGSGKTGSTKSGIVEPALNAGERVAIIDPTGAWWGLRLDADGRTKGLPIYVFGGDHGDYPLLANQGELMAEAIGTSNTPAILDTTKLRTGERMRFFTDFADAILRVNQGPLRLIIDEAHLFAPQAGTRGAGAMPDMLHAANNLISLGRSRGLRVVLISQRPAKVHKDSLTQVETLIAMRLIAPQDRKAVQEWIADQADVDKGKEIVSSLPSLKTGEAWVWSPEASFLQKVTFPKPRTYDSSRGQVTGAPAKRLSPIDVEKLQDRFAKVKSEAEANDPKALRRRIAELEAAAKKAPAVDPGAIEAAEQRGYGAGYQNGLQDGRTEALDEARRARVVLADQVRRIVAGEDAGAIIDVADVAAGQRRDRATLAKSLTTPGFYLDTVTGQRIVGGEPLPTYIGAKAEQMDRLRRPIPVRSSSVAKFDGEVPTLGAERRPLAALAAVYPAGMTEATWAVAAGLRRSGGTWSTYLSRLRTAACIEKRGEQFFATETGMAACGTNIATMPPPGPELIRFWKSKISGVGPMLDALSANYPGWISREGLAAVIGLAASGGTFQTYISRLRSPGLIEVDGQNLRCSPSLMGDA